MIHQYEEKGETWALCTCGKRFVDDKWYKGIEKLGHHISEELD